MWRYGGMGRVGRGLVLGCRISRIWGGLIMEEMKMDGDGAAECPISQCPNTTLLTLLHFNPRRRIFPSIDADWIPTLMIHFSINRGFLPRPSYACFSYPLCHQPVPSYPLPPHPHQTISFPPPSPPRFPQNPNIISQPPSSNSPFHPPISTRPAG